MRQQHPTKLQECTHIPIYNIYSNSKHTIHLRLFTAQVSIRWAECLANFQANAPKVLFAIFLLTCLVFVSNPLINYIFTAFVQVIVICIFVFMKRVKTDMKIWQCNSKLKDVIIPFFYPPILCGSSTPQFFKTTKKCSTSMPSLATNAFQCSYPTVSNFLWDFWDNCSNILLSTLISFVHMYCPTIWVPCGEETGVQMLESLNFPFSNKVRDTTLLVGCDINDLTGWGHRHLSLIPQLVFFTEIKLPFR